MAEMQPLQPPAAMSALMTTLFTSGDYSDIIVQCEADVYKAHRAILGVQCQYFANAFKFREGQTGIIELKEDEPAIVGAMMSYLYTYRYDDTAGGGYPKGNSIIFNAKVYAIGEKYGIAPLKALAQAKFEAVATEYWQTPYLIPGIQTIYETTPTTDRGLRDIVVSISATQSGELLRLAEFKDLLDNRHDFAVDLLREVANRLPTSEVKEYECLGYNCRAEFTAVQPHYCPRCGRANYVSIAQGKRSNKRKRTSSAYPDNAQQDVARAGTY